MNVGKSACWRMSVLCACVCACACVGLGVDLGVGAFVCERNVCVSVDL